MQPETFRQQPFFSGLLSRLQSKSNMFQVASNRTRFFIGPGICDRRPPCRERQTEEEKPDGIEPIAAQCLTIL